MLRLALFSLGLILLSSCGGGGGGGGDAIERCDLPASQGLSAPCCESWGIDACGASLFCAAFDGRTQPTCYPERSRRDRSACKADSHCVSGSCNQEEGMCRSAPFGSCEPAIGCVTRDGGRFACADGSCSPIGEGSLGSVCLENTDCSVGICAGSHCEQSCAGGDGSGPCIRDPASEACTSCLDSAYRACGEEACAGARWSHEFCTTGCDDDPTCMRNRCAVERCELQACEAVTCEGFSSCF